MSPAYEAGQRGYATRSLKENPYPHGTKDWIDWNRGWRDKELAQRNVHPATPPR